VPFDYRKTPFPWFGGKTDAAPHVWAALGDVHHYVEPFAGGLAVLLRRPHPANRTYYSETVNDLDGLLVNAWRSIQWSPDATAEAASWPVSEADLHARHLALVNWRESRNLERLMADPEWHDPKMGGWWLWGVCSWIGSGWASGKGAWAIGDDGRIAKRENKNKPGTQRQKPFLQNNGQGVNAPQLREPGTKTGGEYHPLTMPKRREWMRFLSARLAHVRIVNGDWARVCTKSSIKMLEGASEYKISGVFLDPPYLTGEYARSIHAQPADQNIAADVLKWCLENDTDPQIRIVLAGYEGNYPDLLARGWRDVPWFKKAFIKGGHGDQQHRERLYCSPSCLDGSQPAQIGLFEESPER
jgi:site-specific DNA-adenine methylase